MYFFFDGIKITDHIVTSLYKNYINSFADILSPVVINSDYKLVYYGGIICNEIVHFINESNISYKNFKKNIKNHAISNTTLFYPKIFITNNTLLFKNYPNSLSVIKYFNAIYDEKFIVKLTPFITVMTDINTDYLNLKLNKIKSHSFELEYINQYLSNNYINNLTSINMQNQKYLDNNPFKYILICENSILTPDKDCGSLYIFNFIKVLISLKYNVHFCSAGNFHYDKKYVKKLQEIGVYVVTGFPFCIIRFINQY